MIVVQVNEDSAYAVFISYVEVYNNCIFDLLDDDVVDDYGHAILPETKKLGEDNKRRVTNNLFSTQDGDVHSVKLTDSHEN